MAGSEFKPPRAATLPIALITREAVGYSAQSWLPPAEGWTPNSEAQRFATVEEARDAATLMVARDSGTLALLLDKPGHRRPDFGGKRRG